MKTNNTKTRKKGFTLVEVLVVIAVIAVLIAVAIPVVRYSTLRANASTNAANLRSIEGKLTTMRLQYPQQFDTFLSTATGRADMLMDGYQFIYDLLYGRGAGAAQLRKRFATFTAVDKTLTLYSGVVIEDVPTSKMINVRGSDLSNTINLAGGMQMQVFITADSVVAAYTGVNGERYTKEVFADIADDGRFDGVIENPDAEEGEGVVRVWCEIWDNHQWDSRGICRICHYDRRWHTCDINTMDADGDYKCDICHTRFVHECKDETGAWGGGPDGECDYCGMGMHEHHDNDKDHFCEEKKTILGFITTDTCGQRMSECGNMGLSSVDANYHLCLYCNQQQLHLFDEFRCVECGRSIHQAPEDCKDNPFDGDHLCDICNKTAPALVCSEFAPLEESDPGYATSHKCTDCGELQSHAFAVGSPTCPGCGLTKLECDKEGCSNKPAEGKNFCAAHTCRNASCTNENQGGNSHYCSSHDCRSSDCTADPVSDETRYCSSHKCMDPPCVNANQGGEYHYCNSHDCQYSSGWTGCKKDPAGGSTYCSDHKCASAGCTNQNQGSGSSWGSSWDYNYCTAHDCQANDCSEDPVEGSTYCSDHKCASCNNAVNGSSDYCSTHGCNFTGCSKAKSTGSDYCTDHTCAAEGCTNSNPGSNKHYCASHDCQYQSGSNACSNDPATGSKYCTTHKCRTTGCIKACPGDGKNYCSDHDCQGPNCTNNPLSGKKYCNSHNCQASNCNNDPVEGSSYCTTHKCKDSACPNQRQSSSYLYCASHDCQANNCKTNPVSGSKYCTSHKCTTSGCNNAKSGSSNYCTTHKCTTSGCNNGKSGSSNYCTTHKCQTSGCNNAKSSGSNYCSTCKCGFSGCTSGKGSNGYCDKHTCDTCSAVVANGNTNYCATHKCQSCNNGKSGSGNFCSSHDCQYDGCTSNPISGGTACSSHKCGSCNAPKQSGANHCSDHDCQYSGGCTSDRASGSTACTEHTCTKCNAKAEKPNNDNLCDDCDGGCVTPDTLVTLADGSKKRVDELTYSDTLLVWDFFNGEYAAVPASVIVFHGNANYTVTELFFEDGTSVKTIGAHDFFSVEANEFITIDSKNVDSFVGHHFIKASGSSYTSVELVDYDVRIEYTGSYSLLSAIHNNFIVEDMFSLTPLLLVDTENFFEYFEVGEGMKYDEEKMQADIETYGLYTYEDFADYLTYEQYIALNAPYYKVLVGKGIVTFEDLLTAINAYVE